MRLLHEHGIPFRRHHRADGRRRSTIPTSCSTSTARTASRRSPSTSRRSRGRTSPRRSPAHGTEERFRRFFSRFLDLAIAADPPFEVREFQTAQRCAFAIVTAGSRTQENRPFAILNVDCEGNFSTYSPELLGLSARAMAASRWATSRGTRLRPCWRRRASRAGRRDRPRRRTCVTKRAATSPSAAADRRATSSSRTADFASTETLFCRLHKQATLDVALNKLERLAAAS